MLGLRVGDNPQAIITTTPRPTKTLKEIMSLDKIHITRGSTYENQANLADIFIHQILTKYEGTRLGRQELYAEMLDDNPDALWVRDQIEKLRVLQHPPLTRVVVAIDPQGSNKPESAETGIVVAGLGEDDHGYVLGDSTIRGTPDQWGRAAVTAYYRFQANKIIGEVNNGGDMVEHTVSTVDPKIPFEQVRATRGKYLRAEPISALYEQGKVHHVGVFPELEDQMCEWVPGSTSPDRLDALVWALTNLMIGKTSFAFV